MSNSKTNLESSIQDLDAGTIIGDSLPNIKISTDSEFGVMVFDTSNVTGEDYDLLTPDLGNVLILSEDGDSSDPDDSAAGGVISLEFEQSAEIDSISLLDINEAGSSIALYDRDRNLIEIVEIEGLGDNTIQEITLDVENVAYLELDLAGSGALAGLNYSTPSDSPYSNIYVFGDSLSDTGNLFNTTSFLQEQVPLDLEIPIIPPSPPYFEGRFSSGEIWVDKLAEEFDITLTPSTELSVLSPGSEIPSPITIIDDNPVVSPFYNGSTGDRSVNFAFGLAQTGATGSGELGAFVPGMERQVELFAGDLLSTGQTADSDALYIIWGGSNDYFSPGADPEETIENIETQVETLYALGAREFLVVNLPDLGRIPEANNPDLTVSPEELSEFSDTHNSLLDTSVNEWSDSLTGANFFVLDIDSLFDSVLSDPEEFGFTNVTEPFLDPVTFTPTAGANPDEYFFFDNLHPTEAGHDLVYDFALTTLGVESDVLV